MRHEGEAPRPRSEACAPTTYVEDHHSRGLRRELRTAVRRSVGRLILDRLNTARDFRDVAAGRGASLQGGFFTGPFLGPPVLELNAVIDRLAARYRVQPLAIATAWITRHPARGQVVVSTTTPLRVADAAAGSEKRAIVAMASSLASEGDVVVIDDSSTAGEIIPHLLELKPITVITNFLAVIDKIRGVAGVSLIGLGGEYDSRYHSFLGAQCEEALANLYADVLFASSSAMLGTDVFHQDLRVVGAKKAMMRASRRRVLLMDHSKVGHGALHRVGGVSDFTHVVVDALTPPDAIRAVEDTGVEVLVAPLEG